MGWEGGRVPPPCGGSQRGNMVARGVWVSGFCFMKTCACSMFLGRLSLLSAVGLPFCGGAKRPGGKVGVPPGTQCEAGSTGGYKQRVDCGGGTGSATCPLGWTLRVALCIVSLLSCKRRDQAAGTALHPPRVRHALVASHRRRPSRRGPYRLLMCWNKVWQQRSTVTNMKRFKYNSSASCSYQMSLKMGLRGAFGRQNTYRNRMGF